MSVEIKPTVDKCVPVLLFLLSSLFIIPQFYLLSASVMETKHFYLSSTFRVFLPAGLLFIGDALPLCTIRVLERVRDAESERELGVALGLLQVCAIL